VRSRRIAEGDGPDSAAVTVILPHLTVPADTNTVVLPIGLRNEWDEVGGLQVDISWGDCGLSLDTILTTARTPRWQIDRGGTEKASSRAGREGPA